ncbi:Uncharacterized protein APZ42_009616 [Daphnia magna]|uniref:CCHC-type domain-containing protein n=1 Tax=Daphnia magna TaxID=35525 RepID=A0A162BQK3_9CRUS|nr:Uncharacterized protein APZ42_009616 [Daphnia magna]
MEKMQRQLSTRRNGYHSISNCKARESQANDKCFRCKEIGHRTNFCPQIQNLKPSPSEGYDRNGKKLISFEERGN